jgi:hypothetical protein
MARKCAPGTDGQADTAAARPLLHWSFIIGAGIFATTLSQPEVLDLPLRNLLRDDLHVTQQEMAAFFALGALPWYFKILAGFLSDSVPLFGTRRRHYLIVSACFAAALWLVLGQVPRSYSSLLFAVVATNAMLVIGSTVIGGLLVEAGQRLGDASRLVSVRVFVESACVIVAGPLAGTLAGLPFGAAAAVGGAIAFTLAPVAWIVLNEPPAAKYNSSALADAYTELRDLGRSPVLWLAGILLLLTGIPQEFSTSLYYYQRTELRLTDDVIGYLKGLSGFGSVLAAAAYGYISPRVPLRFLLQAAIIGGAVGTIIYCFYWSLGAAIAIEFVHGVLLTLWTLALMEVAVWATPQLSAAAGFAVLMSIWNVGSKIGDNLGAVIVERWSFSFFGLAGIYAILTLLTLYTITFLPRSLFDHHKTD